MKFYYSLIALFLLPSTAWAYFDIGTGTYLFQIILASFFGIIFTLRTYISMIFRKLWGKSEVKKLEEPE